jgi:hypothetical protein
MPRVVFSLAEQFSDLRSNQVAYNFRVENNGSAPISVTSLTPRIPEGVKLVEVRNPSQVVLRTRITGLCGELTELLGMQIENELPSESKEQTNPLTPGVILATGVGSLLTAIGSIFLIPIRLLQIYRDIVMAAFSDQPPNESVEERIRRVAQYEIRSVKDAEVGLKRWMEDADEPLRSVYASKLEQLRDLDVQAGATESRYLATIEPESFFAVTYVLDFPRSALNPRKYNVTIEANYEEQSPRSLPTPSSQPSSEEGDDSGRPRRPVHVGGATTSLLISPRPLLVSLIALLGACLGTVLNASANTGSTGGDFAEVLSTAFFGGTGVTAAILAVVLFNVYEHTSLSGRINLGVSWRSALLIGALCGLGSDRVLDALQAFLGGNA